MRRDKIFVSYNRRDKSLFDEFRKHLGFWSEEGQIQIWCDQDLQISQRWEEEKSQAMDSAAVAVLMVSPDFLNSEFIRQKELPAFLGAREDGLLGICNLFLRPSGVEREDCIFDARLPTSGDIRKVHLTDYQVLNTPTTEITSFEENARERQYEEAIDKLIQLYAQYKQPGSRKTRSTHHRLVIRLRVDGRYLKQRYLGPYSSLGEHRTSWAEIKKQLNGTKRDEALFQILFGLTTEDQSADVLQKLLERSGKILPNPTVTALRICIETDSHELADLPWSECSWERQSLTELGWTFEFNPLSQSYGQQFFPYIELHTPCPVLAITPTVPESANSGTVNHLFALQKCLDNAWPIYKERLLEANTFSETINHLKHRSPDIVYYCGRTQVEQETLKLALPSGNGPWIAMDELAKYWRTKPPRILILTLLDHTPPEVGARLQNLLPSTQMVLVQHWSLTDIQRARRSVLAWLQHMLEGDGLTDPVAALTETADSTTSACTGYSTWRVHTPTTPPQQRLARLLLDRWEQRSMARAMVDEMRQYSHHRVTCFVPYSEQGNMVDHAPEQFLEYLRRHTAEDVHIKTCDLDLPPDEANFDLKTLQRYVQRQIFSEGIESEVDWLEAHRARTRDYASAFLFINWGCRKQSDEVGLTGLALEAWVAYCAQVLTEACPDGLDILCCLALERPNEHYALREGVLKHLQTNDVYTSRSFSFVVLPDFNDVDEAHLKQFLSARGNSIYPEKLISEMSRYIIAHSKGSFIKTINLVERAEIERWYDLYDKLKARYKDLPVEEGKDSPDKKNVYL